MRIPALLLTIAIALQLPGVISAQELSPEPAATNGDFSEFADEFDNMPEEGFSDPLQPFNRAMFVVNDRLYFWLLKPIGWTYGKIVPKPGRLAIARCASNLTYPRNVVNNLLQLKFCAAGVETTRFLVNSTVGVAGLFDPAASKFNLNAYPEDFGQTLGHYGIGSAIPLLLPILGPTNLRDAVGMVPDYFLDPVNYVDEWQIRTGVRAGTTTNEVSLRIGEYEDFKKSAVDPYVMLMDAYRQNRLKKVEE